MSKKRKVVPDTANTSLIDAVCLVSAERRHSLAAAAKAIGCTYAYLMALGRGERPTEQLSKKHILGFAAYLNLPPAQVFMLAGVLVPEDFIYKPTCDEKFDQVHKSMMADPVWCGHAPRPAQWKRMETETKLLISLLYERAARTQFFTEV